MNQLLLLLSDFFLELAAAASFLFFSASSFFFFSAYSFSSLSFNDSLAKQHGPWQQHRRIITNAIIATQTIIRIIQEAVDNPHSSSLFVNVYKRLLVYARVFYLITYRLSYFYLSTIFIPLTRLIPSNINVDRCILLLFYNYYYYNDLFQ